MTGVPLKAGVALSSLVTGLIGSIGEGSTVACDGGCVKPGVPDSGAKALLRGRNIA